MRLSSELSFFFIACHFVVLRISPYKFLNVYFRYLEHAESSFKKYRSSKDCEKFFIIKDFCFCKDGIFNVITFRMVF